MAFILAEIDQDAISKVNITGDPSGFNLDSSNIQFPPIITKDSKSASWQTHEAQSYEPIAFFKSGNPREIGLEFQWVIGGEWTPDKVHTTISKVKGYFYTAYKGSALKEYPAVIITNLYNIITQKTTWRMDSVNITYSPELIKLDGAWYPLHVKMAMNLLSATRLAGESDKTPMQKITKLESKPELGWY
jgi:hypothetical protein